MRKRSWLIAALGLLSAVGVVLVLHINVAQIDDARAYRAAPVCPPVLPGSDCRGELFVSVIGVDVEAGRDATQSLYLFGSTPEIGWTGFPASQRQFVQSIHDYDGVNAEIWRDHVTAVTAHGVTAPTTYRPGSDRDVVVVALVILELITLVLLRWSTHRRIRWSGGELPRRRRLSPAMGGRRMRTPQVIYWFQVTTVALGITGTWLLGDGHTQGAWLCIAAVIALLYGFAVPQLSPIRALRDIAGVQTE